MKKIACTAILLLLAVIPLFAQRLSFGLKAGTNISGAVNYSKAANASLASMGFPVTGLLFKSKLCFSFHGGLFANLSLSRKWYIQSEVLYSSQQYKLSAPYNMYSLNGTANLHFTLSYINMPLLLQYRFAPQWFIEAGPQLGILTALTAEGTATHFDSQTKDMKNRSNTLDYSLALGGGYRFPTFPMGIYVRATAGFRDVLKDNNTGYTFKNYLGQMGVYYRLGK